MSHERGSSVPVQASVAALVVVTAVALLGAASPQVPQTPTFRAAVDYIAVDVQVIDRDGRPVDQLGPEKFDVSIGGKRRRVVSAAFVRNAPTDGVAPQATPRPGGAARSAAAATEPTGRTFMVAIDESSLDIAESRGAAGAVAAFIKQLEPNDLVGVYSYPLGPRFRPTRNHAELISRLTGVVGSRRSVGGEYHLTPLEVVDITAQMSKSGAVESQTGFALASVDLTDTLARVQQRECTGDPRCLVSVQQEALSMAFEYEAQANRSLHGLRGLVSGLADLPGRKTVVVLSGGIVASDRLGGRPDVGELPKLLGQEAARANIAIYALHLDSSFLQMISARSAKSDFIVNSDDRNSEILRKLMVDFSAASGGAFIPVLLGSGDEVLRRVLRETSAHYLLAVQADEADRDGKIRELRVKVKEKDIVVRSRMWVVVPKRTS